METGAYYECARTKNQAVVPDAQEILIATEHITRGKDNAMDTTTTPLDNIGGTRERGPEETWETRQETDHGLH